MQGSYVDAKTGIKFATWSPQGEEGGGPFTFGLVLPADAMSVNVTEYIGMLVGTRSARWETESP